MTIKPMYALPDNTQIFVVLDENNLVKGFAYSQAEAEKLAAEMEQATTSTEEKR